MDITKKEIFDVLKACKTQDEFFEAAKKFDNVITKEESDELYKQISNGDLV